MAGRKSVLQVKSNTSRILRSDPGGWSPPPSTSLLASRPPSLIDRHFTSGSYLYAQLALTAMIVGERA